LGSVGVLAVAATKERRAQQLRDGGGGKRAKKKANYTALQAANEQMLSQKAALEAKLHAMDEQRNLEASIREGKLVEQTAQIAQLNQQV
jgi:phage I-like protein